MESATQAPACPNCGTPEPGRYCPECGQRQGIRVASVRRILLDALDDQFSINSALPRTLVKLLTRPGFLTVEYFRGRIERYVPPFRLYLATSITFFLILSIVTTFRPELVAEVTSEDRAAAAEAAEEGRVYVAVPSSGPFLGIRLDRQESSDTTFVRVNFGHARLNARAAARVQELVGLPPDEIARDVGTALLERAPTGMFLLLPVFAALLKLLYIRSGRYYVEHFVFALHTHSFSYIAFTLLMPFDDTPVGAALFLWVLAYYFLAMRRFYGQGVVLTLAKYATLLVLYSLLLTFALLGIVAAALLLG